MGCAWIVSKTHNTHFLAHVCYQQTKCCKYRLQSTQFSRLKKKHNEIAFLNSNWAWVLYTYKLLMKVNDCISIGIEEFVHLTFFPTDVQFHAHYDKKKCKLTFSQIWNSISQNHMTNRHFLWNVTLVLHFFVTMQKKIKIERVQTHMSFISVTMCKKWSSVRKTVKWTNFPIPTSILRNLLIRIDDSCI